MKPEYGTCAHCRSHPIELPAEDALGRKYCKVCWNELVERAKATKLGIK